MIFHCMFSGGRDGKHLAIDGEDGLQLLVGCENESKVLSIFSPKLLKSGQLEPEGLTNSQCTRTEVIPRHHRFPLRLVPYAPPAQHCPGPRICTDWLKPFRRSTIIIYTFTLCCLPLLPVSGKLKSNLSNYNTESFLNYLKAECSSTSSTSICRRTLESKILAWSSSSHQITFTPLSPFQTSECLDHSRPFSSTRFTFSPLVRYLATSLVLTIRSFPARKTLSFLPPRSSFQRMFSDQKKPRARVCETPISLLAKYQSWYSLARLGFR